MRPVEFASLLPSRSTLPVCRIPPKGLSPMSQYSQPVPVPRCGSGKPSQERSIPFQVARQVRNRGQWDSGESAIAAAGRRSTVTVKPVFHRGGFHTIRAGWIPVSSCLRCFFVGGLKSLGPLPGPPSWWFPEHNHPPGSPPRGSSHRATVRVPRPPPAHLGPPQGLGSSVQCLPHFPLLLLLLLLLLVLLLLQLLLLLLLAQFLLPLLRLLTLLFLLLLLSLR